jgi:hypothetical protein
LVAVTRRSSSSVCSQNPDGRYSGCENACGDPMDCRVRSQSLGLRLRTPGDPPQSLPHPAAVSIGWTPPIAFPNEISGTVPGAGPSRRCSQSATESRASLTQLRIQGSRDQMLRRQRFQSVLSRRSVDRVSGSNPQKKCGSVRVGDSPARTRDLTFNPSG